MSTGMKKYGEKSGGINLVKLCMLIKRMVNTTEELDKVIHAVNVTTKRIREIEGARDEPGRSKKDCGQSA